jgi:SH3 domain protein
MKKIKLFFVCFVFSVPFSIFAQEANAELETSQAFITDDLFVYMHAGSGNNYRILGTVIAGTQIKLTGLSQNEYTQILDEKNRLTWIESKYVSEKPGLRFVVAELNAQLADATERNKQLDSQLNNARANITDTNTQSAQLNNEIATLKNQLASTKSKLKTQDTDIQKQWFFNGAIVLGLGLVLGLILPRLGGRKRSNVDNWK